jgi:hypothetical protein
VSLRDGCEMRTDAAQILQGIAQGSWSDVWHARLAGFRSPDTEFVGEDDRDGRGRRSGVSAVEGSQEFKAGL